MTPEQELTNFIIDHSTRGDCTCGKCFDAKLNPLQPSGHTANMTFFKVALTNEVDKDIFIGLINKVYPDMLDGNEHGYMELGGVLGDQGIALQMMGLGSLVGVWKLFSPDTMMPFLPPETKMQMAGRGLITIKVG